MTSRLHRLLLAALLCGRSGAALADARFDIDHLQLAVTSGEFLATEGAGQIQPWDYRAGAAFGFTDRPLLMDGAGGTAALIETRETLDVYGAVQLGRRFGVGLDLPVLLAQSGSAVDGGAAAGDLKLFGRLDVVVRGPVRFAVVAALRVPSGDQARFFGDGNVVGEPRLVLQVGQGKVRGAINLGARFREGKQYGDLTVGNELFARLALDVRPHQNVDLFAEAAVDTALSSHIFTGASTPLELLVGAGGRGRGVAGRIACGFGVVDGFGAPRVRVVATLAYERPARPPAEVVAVKRPVVAKAPPPKPPAPKPADPPPPAEPEVDPEEPNVSVSPEIVELADPVFFDLNRKHIKARFHGELEELARAVNKRAWIKRLWISGHADITGSHEWNRTLSRMRADEVRKFLVAHGVDEQRLRTLSYGDTMPWFSNAQEEGRAKNRRAAFLIEREGADASEAQSSPHLDPADVAADDDGDATGGTR